MSKARLAFRYEISDLFPLLQKENLVCVGFYFFPLLQSYDLVCGALFVKGELCVCGYREKNLKIV